MQEDSLREPLAEYYAGVIGRSRRPWAPLLVRPNPPPFANALVCLISFPRGVSMDVFVESAVVCRRHAGFVLRRDVPPSAIASVRGRWGRRRGYVV